MSVETLGFTRSCTYILSAPAASVLRYESRLFPTLIQDNPFVGPPRDELERAWHNLLEPMNIHVPAVDVKRLGLESVKLHGGEERLVQLGVYHELHCLVLAC